MLSGFKKQLLTQIGIALGTVLVFALFIILLNSDINKRIEQINKYRGDLAFRNQTIEVLSTAKSDLVRAQPLINNLEGLLPDKDSLVNFPRELEQIAKARKVDFGFGFGNEQAGSAEAPGFIRFTMTAVGEYGALIAFLSDLEAHHYFISLDTFDMTRQINGVYSVLSSGIIYTK